MPKFSQERFEFIEMHSSPIDVGVSAQELAEKFDLKPHVAATWLSKWTNYYNEQRDIVQHYLQFIPGTDGNPGRYKIGPSPWSQRAFDSDQEVGYVDKHDVEGITDILGIISGEIRTRTDELTGKRTAAGLRTTKERLQWIASLANIGGVSAKEYSDKYNCSIETACTTLSRWKSKGLLDYRKDTKRYKISDRAFSSLPQKPDVKYDTKDSLANRLKLGH